ncbi:MAG: ribosomal protein S18-alanine N-acetyltransferase, partial [Haloarculaceae archaeon]
RIEQESFPQPWPFAALEKHLGEPGFLVAETGPVIGYIVAATVPSHVEPLGHIKDLAVRADSRGQGVGTRLLERALAVLDARGIPSVKLEVREGNEPARRLYHSHGFGHRRTVPGYYSDGDDAIVMVRS